MNEAPQRTQSSTQERWLLLRGLSRERAHWFGFPERLRQASGLDVLCLDLPGAGSERLRSAPLRIADYAVDVLARVREQERGGHARWRVFGISLGGMVGLELAQRFGAGLAGIVLCNSSVGDCPLHQRLQPRAASMLVRALLEPSAERRERAIFRLTSSLPDAALAGAVSEAVAIHEQRPITRRAVLAQLWAASRFRLPASLPVPLLVLGAARDRLAHPACSARIAQHFGAPYLIHPTAGHDLPLDDPDWLCQQLVDFQRATP